MANAWQKFRAWPKWAQITTWVVLAFVVIGALAPDADEEVATTESATTTEAAKEAPPPTADPLAGLTEEEMRQDGARRCIEAAEVAVAENPGVVAELNAETIEFLVASAVNGLGETEFPSPQARSLSLEGCRQATQEHYENLMLTATTVPAVPIQILAVDGSADTDTDDFTVDGTWQLSWSVDGGAGLLVAVRSPAGEMIDNIDIDPGESSSQFRQGCTCYLEVSTFGSTYELVVTDVP